MYVYIYKGSTPGFPLCLRVVRVDCSWLHDFTSATQPPSHDNRKETAAGTGGVKGWRWVSLSGKHMKNHPYLVKGSTPGFPLCLRVVRVDGSWLHDFTSATQNPTLNISSVSLLLSEQKIPGSCWYLACIILNCLCEELREHVHAE